MLVVRLSQLAAGGSGINPAIADALAELINSDAVPEVREFGGIGTADLQVLAGTAPTMSANVHRWAAMRLRFARRDGPPRRSALISSSALTIGQAVLSQQKLSTLLDNAASVSALSFIAMSGNPEALGPPVAAAARHVRSRRCSTRATCDGPGQRPARPDPRSLLLRTLPQVFGSETRNSRPWVLCGRLVTAGNEIRSYTARRPTAAMMWPTTGSSKTNLARRVDALQLAIGAACNPPAEDRPPARPQIHGPAPFLAEDGSGQSGLMMLEYVAAAAVGRIRANAQPVSLQTVVLSLGAEEDASFASVATARLESTADALAMSPPSSLCAPPGRFACRETTPGVQQPQVAGHDAGRFHFAVRRADRDLRGDLEQAIELMRASH